MADETRVKAPFLGATPCGFDRSDLDLFRICIMALGARLAAAASGSVSGWVRVPLFFDPLTILVQASGRDG